MKTFYRYFLNSPSTLSLGILTLVALIFNSWVSTTLTSSYIASKFPVPYYVAQLSFDPEKLKAWYSDLQQMGTFDIYVSTQHIDSLFILSVLMLHCFALVLISRLFSTDSKGRKIMVACALISSVAPISDQLENLVSYIMLANPANFADAMAYIYSSFAAIKFAFFVFAYVVASLGLIAGLISLLINHYHHIKSSTKKHAASH